MRELVFATNNKHKLEEISHIVGDKFKIIGLKDINCFEEIPETADTIEQNASQKSFYVYNRYGYNCFADDTGLEIDSLDGRPGVYSARYAGEGKNFDDNMNKVLIELSGVANRKAIFRTMISLVINGKEFLFEGRVSGVITSVKYGNNGFGYDPIFKPDGFTKTYAEMTIDEKNKFSHRALAVKKLIDFLNKL
jgi:XTP/dITP diphosphohydrolase